MIVMSVLASVSCFSLCKRTAPYGYHTLTETRSCQYTRRVFLERSMRKDYYLSSDTQITNRTAASKVEEQRNSNIHNGCLCAVYRRYPSVTMRCCANSNRRPFYLLHLFADVQNDDHATCHAQRGTYWSASRVSVKVIVLHQEAPKVVP